MEPAVADCPMTGYQRGGIVLLSGQVEKFLGCAMRSVDFGPHVEMHELAPQRLEQMRRVIQHLAETTRPRVGMSSLLSRMAGRSDQRAAERELKFELNALALGGIRQLGQEIERFSNLPNCFCHRRACLGTLTRFVPIGDRLLD